MLIFEHSSPGRRNYSQAPITKAEKSNIPKNLLRNSPPLLPEVSEMDTVRHYTRLSQKNFSIDTEFYPLGSGTMEYNPRACNALAMLPQFLARHPLAPEDSGQGFMACMYEAHPYAFHVMGNHDLEFVHTKAQCLATWRMPARYYAQIIACLRVLILDGNDPGSPAHQGGYPSYIGPEQMQWLQNQLAEALEPILIVSHQPLAGTYPMDNAAEVQALLSRYAQKIILAINGHTHIDDVLEVGGVIYLHVNSASYVWVGESFKHDSYAQDILSAHPYIANTRPYAESLFTSLTIHPRQNTIHIKGRATTWVGPSPAEIRANTFPGLVVGEQIAPHIRPRVHSWNPCVPDRQLCGNCYDRLGSAALDGIRQLSGCET